MSHGVANPPTPRTPKPLAIATGLPVEAPNGCGRHGRKQRSELMPTPADDANVSEQDSCFRCLSRWSVGCAVGIADVVASRCRYRVNAALLVPRRADRGSPALLPGSARLATAVEASHSRDAGSRLSQVGRGRAPRTSVRVYSRTRKGAGLGLNRSGQAVPYDDSR